MPGLLFYAGSRARFPAWGTPPERRQPHEAIPPGRRGACAC